MENSNRRLLQEIEKFYEHLKLNQLTEHQEAAGYGSKRYTADMWTLDVCERLLGRNEKVESYAKAKLALVESLNQVKDDADQICVGEVGRGLDIVIANLFKQWEVICYDHNPIYDKYLDKYFSKVNFYPTSTVAYLERIKEFVEKRTIFIIDNTRCRDFKALEENENIVHLIFYGKLLW